MNKNIIIVAIIVIIIAIVGIFAFSLTHTSDDKVNTQINFLSEKILKNGEAVQFELKDIQGNVLANENISILFEEEGVNQTYNIVTDSEGKGSLVLNNEYPGTYKVFVSYNGSDKYNGCTAEIEITIEEGTSTESSYSTTSESTSSPSNSSAGTSLYNGNSSSSSNSNLHYDSQYNFYYDDNGIIRGGQNDGYSADYIRNSYESGNMVDDDGNLQ